MILYPILFILTCYILVCAGVYFYQERIIFFPEPLPNDYLYRFESAFEEHYIKVDDNIKLHALLFRTSKPKGCVLYHHGNSRNLVDWASNYSDFLKNGYDVLFYDYRGYGKSSGKIESEQQLVEDALKIHEWLLEKYPSHQIVQYGRSLGSGIAVQVALKVVPPKLILETPYFSILYLAKQSFKFLPIQFLLKYHFESDKYLKQIKNSVFFIHGTNDKLIKHENSEKLSEINTDFQLFTIQGGSHNNLPGFKKYQEVLSKILN